ncbi:MAG: DNA methyltransferase [Planctomycetes bacterium]|nr:DNA methyltransferase [Planctomycetota bacterium]
MQENSERIIKVIRGIPEGHVLSYGEVGRRAGLGNGARMVTRILHSASETRRLPWHRVVNSRGRISLTGDAYELQRTLLQNEGIEFGPGDTIDLVKYA